MSDPVFGYLAEDEFAGDAPPLKRHKAASHIDDRNSSIPPAYWADSNASSQILCPPDFFSLAGVDHPFLSNQDLDGLLELPRITKTYSDDHGVGNKAMDMQADLDFDAQCQTPRGSASASAAAATTTTTTAAATTITASSATATAATTPAFPDLNVPTTTSKKPTRTAARNARAITASTAHDSSEQDEDEDEEDEDDEEVNDDDDDEDAEEMVQEKTKSRPSRGSSSSSSSGVKKTRGRAKRKRGGRPEVQRVKRAELNDKFVELKYLCSNDKSKRPSPTMFGRGDRSVNSKEAILRIAGEKLQQQREQVEKLERMLKQKQEGRRPRAATTVKSENKVSSESLKYQMDYHNSAVPRCITTVDGSIIDFNEAFCKLFDTTVEHMRQLVKKGDNIFTLSHPETLPQLFQNATSLLSRSTTIVHTNQARSIATHMQRHAVYNISTWITNPRAGPGSMMFDNLFTLVGYVDAVPASNSRKLDAPSTTSTSPSSSTSSSSATTTSSR